MNPRFCTGMLYHAAALSASNVLIAFILAAYILKPLLVHLGILVRRQQFHRLALHITFRQYAYPTSLVLLGRLSCK